MEDKQLTDWHQRYLLETYSPDLMLSRGSMSRVWDDEGREYLDFTAGISVCNLGHCHPRVTEAIQRQAASLVHVSNLFYNQNQPRLAKRLVEKAFPGKVFFCNSGAEANEAMIKFARRWGGESRHGIICMEDSFHGRTLATLAATGRAKYRAGFQPDTPGFTHVPFNSIEAVEEAADEHTVAVLAEPIQGEGGVMPADPEFLRQLRRLCDQRGWLLLFDEVQCGMGRTGELFAFQHYGVEPDGFTLAKALGNGFPIGALVVRSELSNVFTPGTHASTFGGNPLACAAGLAVLDAFEQEEILDNCRHQAGGLWRGLEELRNKYSFIGDIRGIGLMIGMDLSGPVKPVLQAAAKEGLLVLAAGERTLRLLPPLIIDEEEVQSALERLDRALRYCAENGLT